MGKKRSWVIETQVIDGTWGLWSVFMYESGFVHREACVGPAQSLEWCIAYYSRKFKEGIAPAPYRFRNIFTGETLPTEFIAE